MDLALIIYKGWYAIKNQPTNQSFIISNPFMLLMIGSEELLVDGRICFIFVSIDFNRYHNNVLRFTT